MKKSFLILFFLVFGLLLFNVSYVEAADPNLPIRDSNYSAKYVDQSINDPINIIAGSNVTVTVRFKNTGSAVWRSGGSRFISAYTVEPKYRDSFFRGTNWIGGDQTAPISGDVYSGQIGELKINLVAPNKPGEYVERFYLAAENYSWVANSYFYLKINVTEAVNNEVAIESTEQSSIPAEVPVSKDSNLYKASRFILSVNEVSAQGGEQIKIIVGYQNIGESSWQKYSLVAGSPVLSSGESVSFADESWKNSSVVLQKEQTINVGSFVREIFYLRTPPKAGVYLARFLLMADDKLIDSEIIEIPVTVTSDASSHYVAPIFEDSSESFVYRLVEEPFIRVGLWKDAKTVEFISEEDNYNIFNGTALVGILPKGTLGTLSYASGNYSFSGAGISFKTVNFIRLEPVTNPHAVFTLRNFERQISWKGPRNFNKYRGSAEYRVTNDGSSIYLINEVLFEDYVAGIGETSNTAPIEYIKALLTAGRTYAYYIQKYSDKHNVRNFDVVATTGDQLYLGYVHETLAPRVVEAARATSGNMITYNGDVVITPYFGNSDGRTRTWTEVWGGTEKPWLVSVKANYDARDSKSLFGHGVGMSQRDAAYRAEEQGLNFIDLIKYYYTSVTVEKFYPSN